ncbi:DNA topoisomerase 2-binding protein 1 [Lunasporangiospora selenospora]|uniref:DNA topoisomerase 2-binding protein 1 n=1 Tax=Lunasporangiospora selenospora TaxID=979761 RepID=A0A9P6FV03_9FUNG|nr:DNA topoisomerase 2-binding protein 1 [Lunasporangiospora selenospora]
MVLEMGGSVDVNLSDGVTHLIANKAGSQKYRVAFNLKIPVVEPGWVARLYQHWTEGKPIDMKAALEEFMTGPLKGCNVCVTGYAADIRQEIQQCTLHYGGKYSSDMHKGLTTHLIYETPTGKKYESALLWGIKCVPYEGLQETMHTLGKSLGPQRCLLFDHIVDNNNSNSNTSQLSSQALVDETKYSINEQDGLQHGKINTKPRTRETASRRLSMLREREIRDTEAKVETKEEHIHDTTEHGFLENCCVFICPSFNPGMAQEIKDIVLAGGGAHIPVYHPNEVTHAIVPSDVIDSRMVALFDDTLVLPYIVNHKWLIRSHQEGKTLAESDYIVPFPPHSENEGHKSRKHRGDTFWTLDPAVKAASNADDSHDSINTINASDSNGRTHQSTNEVSVLNSPPKTDRSNQRSPSKSKEKAIEKLSRSYTSIQGLKNRTMSGILAGVFREMSVDGSGDEGMHPIGGGLVVSEISKPELNDTIVKEPSPKIFLGLYITTFDLKPKQVDLMRRETMDGGGTFLAEGESSPVADNCVRTIVHYKRSWETVKHLKGVVVNNLWFDRSVYEEKAIPKNHVLYRPFKRIPIDGFQDLLIHISCADINEVEQEHYSLAITALGGKYCQKIHSVTSDPNVLVTDRANTKKYRYMSAKRCPVVGIEWLKHCIEEGQLAPFDKFEILGTPLVPVKVKREEYFESQSVLSSQQIDRLGSGHRSHTPFQPSLDRRSVPSDKPLEGLVICLLPRVPRSDVLQDLIQDLGARLLTSYDSSATHFVHKGKATPQVQRDLRASKRDGLIVVSPTWLERCKETGLRENERDYPETFDEKRMTLQMTTTPTSSQHPNTPIRPQRSSSPSLRANSLKSGSQFASTLAARRSSPGSGMGRSVSVGPYGNSQMHGGDLGSTQTFQGTAAGATSAMFAEPATISSSKVPLSLLGDHSLEMQSRDTSFVDSTFADNSALWPSAVPSNPLIPRKKRKWPFHDLESNTAPVTPAEEEPGDMNASIPENYFDPCVQRGVNEVFWDDVKGRQNKILLMKKLGYTTLKSAEDSKDASDPSSLVQEKEEVTRFFLLSGISLGDRSRFGTIIRKLGGVVLEEETHDQDVWKEKVTHLVTAGNNPPKTIKLVIAKATRAHIVNKGFVTACEEQSEFVDEEPFRVNL